MPETMRATIFIEPGRIILGEKPVPQPGPGDALIRITTTTICGTDIHILKGEYPVASGLTIGHEPVGVIEKLGSAVTGFTDGQRVIAGAITPAGWDNASLSGCGAQCGAGTAHGWKAMGGWRFGNTIDGAQADYLLVPDAMANLAPIPDGLTDEQVLMCPDILSTGFGGAEAGRIRIGDTVAIFAQGPIGLCATAGARLMGATRIIAVESVPERVAVSRRMGADEVVHFTREDPVAAIDRLTGGRGVDVAIEALGQSGDLCVGAQGLASRRHPVVAGRLCPGSDDSAAGLCGRARRPCDPHHFVSRRQGEDAAVDGHGGGRARRHRRAGHPSFPARPDRERL